MSDANPSAGTSAPNSESSLEDIDRLLAADDPDFAKSLDEVRAIVPDVDVSIESISVEDSVEGESEPPTSGTPPVQLSFVARQKLRWRLAWIGFRNRQRERLLAIARRLFVFLKTAPKEFLLFMLAMLKVFGKKLAGLSASLRSTSWLQRLSFLLLVALGLGAAWVGVRNLKGIWLPLLQEPVLSSFEPYADSTHAIAADDLGISFYTAFPQDRHEFLFIKMKVNLRATRENPLPMGAFEIIVEVDSSDSSIEVRDREVEFRDLLQRTLEEETFNDLATELGKTKLKSRIKRELNQKLTQGWVRDVSFRTFVLKP